MRTQWVKDTFGWYFLPFVAYSNTANYGKALWFGFGYWLWMWQLKAPKP